MKNTYFLLKKCDKNQIKLLGISCARKREMHTGRNILGINKQDKICTAIQKSGEISGQ